MSLEAAIPLLVVVGMILVAPDTLLTKRWAQALVIAGVALLVARYLQWRVVGTVLPVEGAALQVSVVYGIFLVEALAWFDAAVLFAFLLRRTDRSGEADAHEARLMAMDPDDYPDVDVFIATYNEPADVLDRTITGAMALDWPAHKLHVWILDDGRRALLKREATLRGVGYITRPDNKGAKAGNINNAVQSTSAPFILVLDADFVPKRRFLRRTMGFFDDPRIGIVQAPHCFFNADPMQTALGMDKVMPDDQRFFFEEIMPGRDGYDCAFCCGSNGIIRRSALEEIGNALPEGSITEDMLLTLALKRKGYVTRYLNERLAFGLAPEGIGAFFVQRARWARGGIQILFLKEGPFGGPGLKLHERLFFLPTHWITQSLGQVVAMVTPAFFLLTGIVPFVGTSLDDIVSFQVPALVATIAAVRLFAPGAYHPLATLALSTLMAFRLLPVVLGTLVKPHGHRFKVTPKGQLGGIEQDGYTVQAALGLAGLTGIGLLLNTFPTLQIVPFSHLVPVVTFWALLNTLVLLIVAKIATTPPARRAEERFPVDEDATLAGPAWDAEVRCLDLSLSGAIIRADGPLGLGLGDWVGLTISGVGMIPARLARAMGDGRYGVAFVLPSLEARQARFQAARSARRAQIAELSVAVLDLGEAQIACEVLDISPLGAGVRVRADEALRVGDWFLFTLPSGQSIPANATSLQSDVVGLRVGVEFHILDGDARDRLVRKLFTSNLTARGATFGDGWSIAWLILSGAFSRDREGVTAQPNAVAAEPVDALVLPEWLQTRLLREAARAYVVEARAA